MINPEEFQNSFKEWVETLKINFPEREIIAIDGKYLKGSTFDKINSRSQLSMVSAWACKSGLSLEQLSSRAKKDEAEKQTMEKILDHIDVRGNIITIDANGASPAIIEKISAKNGDCVIGLKDNQRTSKRLAQNLFEHEKVQIDKKIIIQNNKGHGREEKRTYEFLVLKDFNVAGISKSYKKFRDK